MTQMYGADSTDLEALALRHDTHGATKSNRFGKNDALTPDDLVQASTVSTRFERDRRPARRHPRPRRHWTCSLFLVIGALVVGCNQGRENPASNGGTTEYEYGEAISYASSIGGLIVADDDLIRIFVARAEDDPTPKATLDFYIKGRSDLDTTETLEEGVPVDISGFIVELTTVNIKSGYVIVDIRQPIQPTTKDDQTQTT